MDGNKLRDVLRKARVFIDCSPLKKVEDDFRCIDRDEICAEIDTILAEPVKNCEVGTTEEQYERYKRRCKAQDCRDCPIRGNFRRIGGESCQLVWAQLPHEEGGAK